MGVLRDKKGRIITPYMKVNTPLQDPLSDQREGSESFTPELQ